MARPYKYSESLRQEICDYYLSHKDEGITMKQAGVKFGLPEKSASTQISAWLLERPDYERQRSDYSETEKRAALAFYHDTYGATYDDVFAKFGYPVSYSMLLKWLSEYPEYKKLRGYTAEMIEAVCKFAIDHPEMDKQDVIKKFGYPGRVSTLTKWLKKHYGVLPKKKCTVRDPEEVKRAIDFAFDNPGMTIDQIEKHLGLTHGFVGSSIAKDPRWETDNRNPKLLQSKKQEVVNYYFDNPSIGPGAVSRHFGGKPIPIVVTAWAKEDPRYLDPATYGYTEEQKREALDLHFSQPKLELEQLEKALGFPLNRRAWRCWVMADPRCASKALRRNWSATAIPIHEKAEAVLAVRLEGATVAEAATRYNMSETTVYKCLGLYDKGGLTELMTDRDIPKKGKNLQASRKPAKAGAESLTEKEIKALIHRNEELEARNEELQFENDACHAIFDILKKDPSLSEGELLTNREKTLVINALRPKYKLARLLDRFGMSKSTYEYNRNAILRPDKYEHVRGYIRDAYEKSGHAYGYRRIAAVLRLPVLKEDEKGISGYGVVVDEKVVRRLMKEENIVTLPAMRLLRYNSYRGTVGKTAPNLLKRDFHSDAPYRKLLTDVTEFHLNNYKVYLSPVLDCFNGEIISWTVSQSPNLELVTTMLKNAVRRVGRKFGVVIHSDQGWAYQHAAYRQMLKDSGWTQSMSRKGCCSDNSAMEGFFGRLKNEFFYNHDFAGLTPEEFMAKLNDWIIWHNEVRIKEGLGYTSPVLYREQWEAEHEREELPLAA